MDNTTFDHYAGLMETKVAAENKTMINGDLSRHGWSLVRIDRIAREPVVIAYSRELAGLPSGYAVYTAAELERIARIPDAGHTVALIHAAKKYGAVLITKEESL